MRKDRPSTTAYKVGINIIALGAKPGMETVLPPGIVEATQSMLVASGAASPRIVRFAHSKFSVALYEAFDGMLPGQFEAFGYRKAFCEQQVRDGIAAGAAQVLVLGAGYDTLGWRLAPEFPQVKFFEIDHPATARLKAKGVATMGQRTNLYLVAEDLGSRRLIDVLADHESWDKEAPTVIVAEGLLMYLPAEAVRDLFSQSAAVCGDNSRIAFTFFPSGKDGRPDAGRWTGLLLWLLKASGEPWLWSTHPDHLAHLLKETGWPDTQNLLASAVKKGVEYFASASK
ncbi:MAG: class I SAM-dependent methyltransferase [Lentisphaerae bacterium]|nr:class I SAM-dependent methyltransferase [Lentisphaerota bacterium]